MKTGRGNERASCEELARTPNEAMSRGPRQARWAVLIAGALGSMGVACSTVVTTKGDTPDSGSTEDTGTTPSTDTTPTGACLQANCPEMTCTPKLTIGRDRLESCYGFTDGAWSVNTPPSVKDCDGQDDGTSDHCTCLENNLGFVICTFDFGDQDPVVTPQCKVGKEHDPVDSSFCNYEDPDTSGIDGILAEWDPDGDGTLDCGLFPTYDTGCPPVRDVELGSTSCSECGTSAAARIVRPSDADVTLSLDPARSYLAVTTPLQSMMVRLSGDAFVDLPGNRLVGLKISAERVRFGSSDWNGFTFSLDKAVPFARAGETFRIPVTQKPTITASGRRDGTPTSLRASSAGDVTGHLSIEHKTWDLDFADRSVAGSFALHLAGRVAQ
jgi:hypothetical protein